MKLSASECTLGTSLSGYHFQLMSCSFRLFHIVPFGTSKQHGLPLTSANRSPAGSYCPSSGEVLGHPGSPCHCPQRGAQAGATGPAADPPAAAGLLAAESDRIALGIAVFSTTPNFPQKLVPMESPCRGVLEIHLVHQKEPWLYPCGGTVTHGRACRVTYSTSAENPPQIIQCLTPRTLKLGFIWQKMESGHPNQLPATIKKGTAQTPRRGYCSALCRTFLREGANLTARNKQRKIGGKTALIIICQWSLKKTPNN